MRSLQSMDNLQLAAVTLHRLLLPLLALFVGAAFGFAGLAGYLYESKRSLLVPYIVTVDRYGAVLAHDDLRAETAVPERALAAELCRFVETLRTAHPDADEFRRAVNFVYAHLRPDSPARQEIDSFYRLRQAAGDAGATVGIDSVLRLGGRVFEICFNETAGTRPRRAYRARLTYEIAVADHMNTDLLRLNPLGLYVTHYTVAERSAGV